MSVDVEWRQGADGLGPVYIFDPCPTTITRPSTGQKQVELKIPCGSGSVVQLLGNDSRSLVVEGSLFVNSSNYDDLDEKRRDLFTGIGNTEGQLHIISNNGQPNSKHLYYKGVPGPITGVDQDNPNIFQYRFEVLLADPTEFEI